MKTAAVWGASGYIGTNLIVALLADGWKVKAILRSAESLPTHLKTQVHDIKLLQYGDDEQTYLSAIDQVDILFNCVGEPTNDVTKSGLYLDAIRKLTNAVKKTQIPRLVHLSTVAVYGETNQQIVTTESPLNGVGVYAQARMEAERILLSIDNNVTKIVIVRIPMVVGSSMASDLFLRIYKTLRLGVFFHLGSKNSKLNCIGVNKLIRIMLAIAKSEFNHSDILQFSDYITWVELVELIKKNTKKSIHRVYIPSFFAEKLTYLFLRKNIRQKIAIFRNEAIFENSVIFTNEHELNQVSTIDDVEAALTSRLNR
jgi:nucleoside-diphosphate-sugar epimerase